LYLPCVASAGDGEEQFLLLYNLPKGREGEGIVLRDFPRALRSFQIKYAMGLRIIKASLEGVSKKLFNAK